MSFLANKISWLCMYMVYNSRHFFFCWHAHTHIHTHPHFQWSRCWLDQLSRTIYAVDVAPVSGSSALRDSIDLRAAICDGVTGIRCSLSFSLALIGAGIVLIVVEWLVVECGMEINSLIYLPVRVSAAGVKRASGLFIYKSQCDEADLWLFS